MTPYLHIMPSLLAMPSLLHFGQTSLIHHRIFLFCISDSYSNILELLIAIQDMPRLLFLAQRTLKCSLQYRQTFHSVGMLSQHIPKSICNQFPLTSHLQARTFCCPCTTIYVCMYVCIGLWFSSVPPVKCLESTSW
jgi:hypothetical protein